MKDKKVQFIVTGFRQNMQFRMFTFERVDGDYTRSAYTVSADTALVRKHGITVQELPLLCLQLLERSEQLEPGPDQPNDDKRTVTFTEEDMLSYAKELASAREASRQRRRMNFRNLSGTAKSDSAMGE